MTVVIHRDRGGDAAIARKAPRSLVNKYRDLIRASPRRSLLGGVLLCGLKGQPDWSTPCLVYRLGPKLEIGMDAGADH